MTHTEVVGPQDPGDDIDPRVSRRARQDGAERVDAVPEGAATERGTVDAHAAVVHQRRDAAGINEGGCRHMRGDLAATAAHGRVERLAPPSLDQLADIDADELID
ncbi:hypothetical protein GCM10009745_80200 [Kribbella yunnanensis]|uniref:Uncharacterized protein n=1 Tax=Kribbella yunnanensis TaxID=190194 RepID=A0ABP4V732_9ACTN